jgi:hypothetical protein
MGYVSLLIAPFLWLAWIPLDDGDGCHVLRVIRGHARAFWISPGMDKDRVEQLLGECSYPNCALADLCQHQYSRAGNVQTDPIVNERQYCESEIGAIFEKRTGDIPRLTRVFSWPLLHVWLRVKFHVAVVCRDAPDSVAEFADKAMSGWEQVFFDLPEE